MGDFNSHHTTWGYEESDENGNWLENWASLANLSLIIDLKQRGTFHSARWNRDYNPDLCWVSAHNGLPLPATITVLDDFPRSQHRPTLLHVGIRIPLLQSLQKPRWNFRKADWNKFAEILDKSAVCIPHNISLSEAYTRFQKAVFSAAKKSVPRGVRQQYTPCLDRVCKKLLAEYKRTGNVDVADRLIEALNNARKERWEETTKNLDLTHSSRKSWNLIRKLNNGQARATTARPCVKPNPVAKHLVDLGKAPFNSSRIQITKNEHRSSQKAPKITTEELTNALKTLKNGKAAGYDNVFPEFLKNLGPATIKWLSEFLTRCITEHNIPKHWRKAKVIAIPKPGKDPTSVSSYRPISLLSVTYKILERIILHRINPTVEAVLNVAQAGFRKGRSTQDQVLALTTHIENGFQQGEKTGAVFLDLTAAYDTVWHKGLLAKISSTLPKWAVQFVHTSLQNRMFRVHMGDKCSKWRKQSNGLPQGSVLAPVLFNLYTNDLPTTESRKFIYADDICITYQSKDPSRLNDILNEDLRRISEYCNQWRLHPSPSKTVSSVFHLHHAKSTMELDIFLNGTRLRHDPKPTYLGITLDRTLTFKSHLQKTAAKIRTRNNLLSMLAGTTWGASATTLRCSALALCYSTAEYCAPVWTNSAHCNKIDSQLNQTMRLISGTIRSTQTEWLPVLSNIAPPALRRLQATAFLLQKVQANTDLPLNTDLNNPPRLRLCSRHPAWRNSPPADFDLLELWRESWRECDVIGKALVNDPAARVPGFDLPRAQWVLLNRFRTGAGPCRYSLHRWGARESPLCDCGAEQTMRHIVEECPATALHGGLEELHLASQDATLWLKNVTF